MCCNDACIIIGPEDQYMGNWYNNATHVFSVAMNVGVVDIHTLLPWPCQILLHIYDTHAKLQRFYMSQIGI